MKYRLSTRTGSGYLIRDGWTISGRVGRYCEIEVWEELASSEEAQRWVQAHQVQHVTIERIVTLRS
jgi:hypothetical protein